jgi:hypothetical protein
VLPLHSILLEAAIGIEPMNKGFAVLLSVVAPSIKDHHPLSKSGFFQFGSPSMTVGVSL